PAAAIRPLSLHDALPISGVTTEGTGGGTNSGGGVGAGGAGMSSGGVCASAAPTNASAASNTTNKERIRLAPLAPPDTYLRRMRGDRKSTRLNSSHRTISY